MTFDHNLFLISQIILKFHTEHGSITAVLCVKFQNDLAMEMDVMDERAFMIFEFKKKFGGIWISFTATTLAY